MGLLIALAYHGVSLAIRLNLAEQSPDCYRNDYSGCTFKLSKRRKKPAITDEVMYAYEMRAKLFRFVFIRLILRMKQIG